MKNVYYSLYYSQFYLRKIYIIRDIFKLEIL